MNEDLMELIRDGLANHPDDDRDAAIFNRAWDKAESAGMSQADCCKAGNRALDLAYDAHGWS